MKIEMDEFEAAEIAARIFDKIKNYFWVVSFPNETASGASWAFGPNKPPKAVLNPDMSWRRPTMTDLIQRILAFENNIEYIKKYQRSWER